MKLKKIVLFQIVLLLLMVAVPSFALANNVPTLYLNKTSVTTGTNVTASGVTEPGAWVPLKVVDSGKNVVVFDVTKADENGDYSISFIVPSNASGVLTVVVGEGKQVATGSVTIKSEDSGGFSGGGGGGGSGSDGGGKDEDSKPPEPIVTDIGSGKVKPNAGGTIGLGDEAVIEIPADAIAGTEAVEVKIEKVSTPPEVPTGLKMLGQVYELSVGSEKNYSFDREVTITFKFDPDAVDSNETPAIHYYDDASGKWVSMGGQISGNTISVKLDHFTKFAVIAVAKIQEHILTDITGHWAEAYIKTLIEKGAITGYPDQTFKPNNNITRAEFATIMVRAFNLEAKTGKIFNDTAGHWARDIIATAQAHGIVNGYSETAFGPNDNITREQMAVMIVRATKTSEVAEGRSFADSNQISTWARAAVASASKNGIITGYPDQTFRPQGQATRAEAATMVVKALK